MEDRRRVRR
ncbi:hypothetical protein Zm00014a_022652 [Zea mays]|uniref:Uncharacterized protein n=1 Tax=Zea mays TaxID=4577 RepID=A0A3L6DKA8_MAIZE|nr:hypothetical protein Zm00014a_022652 [Zea mays]